MLAQYFVGFVGFVGLGLIPLIVTCISSDYFCDNVSSTCMRRHFCKGFATVCTIFAFSFLPTTLGHLREIGFEGTTKTT